MAPKEKPRVIGALTPRRGSNTQVNDMPNTATDTSKKSSRYREMLALPQWQKRRLQMLEKAGWKCVECGAEEQQLHVHHKRYIAGAKPWEYEDEDLAVLCERCHEKAHTPAPARRRPTSRLQYAISFAMQFPEKISRIPSDLIPTETPEGVALKVLVEMSAEGFFSIPDQYDPDVADDIVSDLINDFRIINLRGRTGEVMRAMRENGESENSRLLVAGLLNEVRQLHEKKRAHAAYWRGL